MSIVPFIVTKYLWARNTSLSINIIASITIFGLAIGTAALIIVLSVFNGFEELVSGMFSKYNPDIKIVQKEERPFQEDSLMISKLIDLKEVKVLSRVFEQNCLIQYNETQDFAKIKGIDENFVRLISLDSAIIEGEILSEPTGKNFAYLGLGISNKLGVNIEKFFEQLIIYTPGFVNGKIDLNENNFKKYLIQPVMIYSLKQESDYEIVLTDLKKLREYIGNSKILSSIQIKLNNPLKNKEAIRRISGIVGSEYIVKDRYLQDEAFLKIMNLEKWLFFTLFMFTLVLVSFTIVGTLWMLVIEKRRDISILKSLGMKDVQIQKIYHGVGFSLGLIGILVGFILSLVFYKLQKTYALINVPDDFIVDSYPISLRLTDFIIVAIVVLTIVLLASVLPARKIKEVGLIYREN
ncbi:MAG: ABC transporter permease [Saprospiraceae bacterium]|nr:ABC transporter permease [Saprospiraceae bacterium]